MDGIRNTMEYIIIMYREISIAYAHVESYIIKWMLAMDFNSFIPDILVGIVLTILFFLFREKVFPLPDIYGKWILETKTLDSAYNPYLNMILKYDVILYKEGNHIYGTCEKTYENSSAVEKKYIGNDRKRGIIEGSIEKKYFGKDKIMLHIVIDDFSRESTLFVNLEKMSTNEFSGKFQHLIADQSGIATFKLS